MAWQPKQPYQSGKKFERNDIPDTVSGMPTVHDVAAYIVRKTGGLSAMKLQKLLYYSQAWSLVWDDKPLFRARIEAWASGPVIPSIYREHRGLFKINEWPLGKSANVTGDAKETVDAVLKHYAKRDAQWLSDLTHSEQPWRNARRGVAPEEPSNTEITLAAMAEYYSSL